MIASRGWSTIFPMIKIPFTLLRRSERRYPGILKTIRRYEDAAIPPCPKCGSDCGATVSIGIVGRSIVLSGATDRCHLIPNGPVPGSLWCRGCDSFFGPPIGEFRF